MALNLVNRFAEIRRHYLNEIDLTGRLNTEEVPVESDAARIFLLADLAYGPNRWNDSHEIEIAMGEGFISDDTP